MPLKVTITLGANTFDADGDFIFDEGFAEAFRSWINAQGEDTSGDTLDTLTKRLKTASDKQAATVAANTPTP